MPVAARRCDQRESQQSKQSDGFHRLSFLRGRLKLAEEARLGILFSLSVF